MSSGIPRPLERLGFERRVIEPVMSALVGRPLGAHQRVEDLDRLLEPVDPLGRWRQLEPVAPVLVGVPAGTDAEDEPAGAHVVDRDGLLGEEGRVTERVARDQHAEPDRVGQRGDGGEQGPRLVDRTLGVVVGRRQVVDQPGVVEAERLGQLETLQVLRATSGRPGGRKSPNRTGNADVVSIASSMAHGDR